MNGELSLPQVEIAVMSMDEKGQVLIGRAQDGWDKDKLTVPISRILPFELLSDAAKRTALEWAESMSSRSTPCSSANPLFNEKIEERRVVVFSLSQPGSHVSSPASASGWTCGNWATTRTRWAGHRRRRVLQAQPHPQAAGGCRRPPGPGRLKMNLISCRPATWNEVVGQDRVVSLLKSLLTMRKFTPRGFILKGPEGLGKTSVAYLLSRAFMCSGDNPLGCGTYLSCQSIDKEGFDHFPDFAEIDAAESPGVQDARNMLDRMIQPAALSRRRICLIDEAHRLSKRRLGRIPQASGRARYRQHLHVRHHGRGAHPQDHQTPLPTPPVHAGSRTTPSRASWQACRPNTDRLRTGGRSR